MFYEDAILCHHELELAWMYGRKLHVGFPEKMLEKNIQILVEKGLKVAVVEQTETPKMAEKRNNEGLKSK